MSLQHITRSGGNASGLPDAAPFGQLSRRVAMFGALAVGGLKASGYLPMSTLAAPVTATPTDAGLIAHAARVAALARRCEALAEHRAGLEDRVMEMCPRPEPLPRPSGFTVDMAPPTSAEFAIVATWPAGYDQAHTAWERATAAAQAEHERQEDEATIRLGLPEVHRRSERMGRRLDRWAADLIGMKPGTVAGLSAKAEAALVLMGSDLSLSGGALLDNADLILSVIGDAARLGAGGRA